MSTPDRPIRTGERVYAVLKGRLLDGRYQQGQRLHADDLAAELDVSRQPVFDAFKRLSTEGLVTVKPHVGCTVAVYDMAEIRDFFRLFAAVEGEGAAIAAARRSEADLKALRRLHAQIGGLTELSNRDERAEGYRTLNREFHHLMYAMSGTAMVGRFGASMQDRADFFINSSTAVSPFADNLHERHADHARVLAALEAGDPDAARSAAADHITGTIALIERTLRRYGRRAA